MSTRRCERVAELVRQELSLKLTTGTKDPRIGFITVTHVEMSDDLKYAKVFYTTLGDEKKKKETAAVLEKARGFLQHDLGTVLKLRFTPHLNFFLDTSLDDGMKIDAILRKIEKEEPKN